MANAQVEIKFIEIVRGGVHLYYDGFKFRCRSSRQGKRYWSCVVRECTARLTTEGEILYAIEIFGHSHDPLPFEFQVDTFKARLMERARTETTPIPTMCTASTVFCDEIWNHFENQGHRTNNHLEGWHNKIKKLLKKSHPNIFEVIQLFQLEQSLTEVTILRLSHQPKEPSRRRRYRAIGARIASLKQKLLNQSLNEITYADHETTLPEKPFLLKQTRTLLSLPTVKPMTSNQLNKHNLVQNVQDLRRHQLESTCSDDIIGSVDRVIQYHNISYCVTHKVASTYWVRIFRYLFNDTHTGHVKSPFEISKYDTHLLKYKYIKEIPLIPATENAIMSTFRFMFAREPYTRLWSVFVDKFVLPDNFFWRQYGPEIKRSRKDGTEGKLCDPVSFQEFLRYIANYGTENAAKLDDHYRPLHYGCNPCTLKPNFVGKLETMGADSRYILEKLGISWISDIHNHESRIKEEMSMLVKFNYKVHRLLSSCVSYSDLAARLWKAFQINGYIPANAEMTLTGEASKKEDSFFAHVWKVFKEGNRTSNEMAMQKTAMKLQAYKDVPIDVLKGIQRVFKMDFELFGYDPEPADIFRDLRQ
ncbi:uncharacterized protein [Haliotis asinina]|uniref:uncharacterized protein n=1 Tax=Haliotis asinina TaxID=109174 RepID=UPI003531F028